MSAVPATAVPVTAVPVTAMPAVSVTTMSAMMTMLSGSRPGQTDHGREHRNCQKCRFEKVVFHCKSP